MPPAAPTSTSPPEPVLGPAGGRTPGDPVAKWTVAGLAERATARRASAFLDKLTAQMPFSVTGIQVDGGSEFRADFEAACRDRNLALYVLPPRRPQLNGAVERCNATSRYEFYAVYDPNRSCRRYRRRRSPSAG